VKKTYRFTGMVFSAALAVGMISAVPAVASTSACGGTGKSTTVNGKFADGATFKIECPGGTWNGTVFLFSHGYVVPGSSNPATDAPDPITAGWLLGHGYALAGSSYATTGWAIQQALPDQIATLGAFGTRYGAPTHTIAWGQSLGGIITGGLIQRYPSRFDAALPMCGVLSGAVATWNAALDGAFAFQQLIDPSVAVVHITNPGPNLSGAAEALVAAQKTAAGRARIALGAALGDVPGWFTPLSAEPAATNYSAQENNQFAWDQQVDFPFIFLLRAELEARAGGNPSWNTGVDYSAQLGKSASKAEVAALYKKAGISLTDDLNKLNSATRISADPAAVAYLKNNIVFNGKLSVPVLTMHTTGDGLVVNQNEQAYHSVVQRAGHSVLLRQIFVHRAGHCAFTPAEMITAAKALVNRLATGHWGSVALDPDTMNQRATSLGAKYNVFPVNGTLQPAPASFLSFQPTPYPRPFDFGPHS
jgi:uncharacterized tannase-like protein DUF6351